MQYKENIGQTQQYIILMLLIVPLTVVNDLTIHGNTRRTDVMMNRSGRLGDDSVQDLFDDLRPGLLMLPEHAGHQTPAQITAGLLRAILSDWLFLERLSERTFADAEKS